MLSIGKISTDIFEQFERKKGFHDRIKERFQKCYSSKNYFITMNKIQCSIKQSNKERRNRFKLFSFSNFVITYVCMYLAGQRDTISKEKKITFELKKYSAFPDRKNTKHIYTTITSRDKYLYNYSYY